MICWFSLTYALKLLQIRRWSGNSTKIWLAKTYICYKKFKGSIYLQLHDKLIPKLVSKALFGVFMWEDRSIIDFHRSDFIKKKSQRDVIVCRCKFFHAVHIEM